MRTCKKKKTEVQSLRNFSKRGAAMFEQVIREFSALPQIEAIALGGSRAGSHFDAKSDYDIYLYCREAISEDVRSHILDKYCAHLELGNHFWELEDNGTFLNGIDFDILYRNLDDFTAGVAAVVENCQNANAYTTCMWHNLLHSRILYDPAGRLAEARSRFDVPYPALLKERIISQGWKLLAESMPAYADQIRKASFRGDLISVNHRVSAFLETYFDVIFALNEKTHPGEKRMVQLALETCPLLPEGFEENLLLLFSHMFTDADLLSNDLDRILFGLSKIL